MTLDLAAIEARAAAATAGPWKAEDGYIMQPYSVCGWRVLGTVYHGTLGTPEFIAHAREDIPALLAAVRMLEAENAVLRRVPQRIVQDAYEANAEYDLASRCNKAEKRVTALEEALRPFAALLASHHKHGDDAPVFGVNESVITLGDLRQAAALLSKGGSR